MRFNLAGNQPELVFVFIFILLLSCNDDNLERFFSVDTSKIILVDVHSEFYWHQF